MYWLVKLVVRIPLRIAFNLHYEGRENIPKNEAVIYASNHRTNADPPLAGCGARGSLTFMAKEELFRNKLFGGLIRAVGAFPVSRGKGDTGAIDRSLENLKNGKCLIIFPEGTRSKDGKVGKKGHTGAALIAARSGKPIIPVGICYGEKLKFRTPLTIKYGVPIDPAEYCEICDAPNPRQLVKLKNRYMADIKLLVEGEPDTADAPMEEEANE